MYVPASACVPTTLHVAGGVRYNKEIVLYFTKDNRIWIYVESEWCVESEWYGVVWCSVREKLKNNIQEKKRRDTR